MTKRNVITSLRHAGTDTASDVLARLVESTEVHTDNDFCERFCAALIVVGSVEHQRGVFGDLMQHHAPQLEAFFDSVEARFSRARTQWCRRQITEQIESLA